MATSISTPTPVKSYIDRVLEHYTTNAYTIKYTHDYENDAMKESDTPCHILYEKYHSQFQNTDFKEWDTFYDYGLLTVYRLENDIVAIYNKERFAGNAFMNRRKHNDIWKWLYY
jgi:hypothetical protein